MTGVSWHLRLAGFAYFTPYLPQNPYDAPSTAEEVTAGLDLIGKTTLVTGCNSGIGYETMRVLAHRLLNRVLAAPEAQAVVLGNQAHRSAPDHGIYIDDLSGRS